MNKPFSKERQKPRPDASRTVSRGPPRRLLVVFIVTFFAAWILVTFAILLYYTETAQLLLQSRASHLFLRHVGIGADDYDDEYSSIYQQGDADDTEAPVPVLLTRSYTRSPENNQWQQAEAARTYPGSSPTQQHGTLMVSRHFAWQDEFQHPLSRNVTDIRPEPCKSMRYDLMSLPVASVVFIFCNELIELLLRSIHSVLDRTPPTVLREILLVDDFSDDPVLVPIELGGNGGLQSYTRELPKVRYVRLDKRGGIVGARVKGIEEAKGDVFVILDSHIEVVGGWIEPLLKRMGENPRTVVMPVIDGINGKTWIPEPGGIGCVLGIIWRLVEHAYHPNRRNPVRLSKQKHEYVTSPTMAGGLFAANRQFFRDLGLYDLGMTFWGTENIELSFRIWQCGGSLECTECSHVHHLFGNPKRYSVGHESGPRNKMRTIAVWMDRYADLVWHVLGKPVVDIGDIRERQKLRNDLKCRDFQWFLDHVWPESDVRQIPRDVPYLGSVSSAAFVDSCFLGDELGPCQFSNLMYFKRPKRINPATNDELCLTLDSEDRSLLWSGCDQQKQRLQQWHVTSPGQIRSLFDSSLCVAVTRPMNSTEDERDRQQNLSSTKLRGRSQQQQDNQVAAVPCKDGDQRQIWRWTDYNPPPQFTPPEVG